MKNKKLPVISVVWFLGIVIWALMLFGCTSNKQEPEMYDLLYRDFPNVVYKSITIEDYKAEDVCSS